MNENYDENGLYSVIMKKVDKLCELIDSIYNSANVSEKESLKDVKQSLDSYKNDKARMDK